MIVALALCSACSGEIVDPSGTNGEPGAAGDGVSGERSPDGSPTVPGSDPAVCEGVEREPGRVVLRRLNRQELSNTVRDLLGAGPEATSAFSQDSASVAGFVNDAQTLNVGAVFLGNLSDLAGDLAGRALTSDAFRDRYLGCDPAATGLEACAEESLAAFGRDAWRRPLAAGELTSLVTLVQLGANFEDGMRLAVRAMLLSPNFLYRPEPSLEAPRALNAWELASRLSYFLWSSMPDERLYELAESGALLEEGTLRSEVARMVEDPRFAAFSTEFGEHWLHVSDLSDHEVTENVYPDYDDALEEAMRAETQLFVQHIVRENLPIATLLRADFTFLNERLAAHYGIEGVSGGEMRQVPTDGATRGGVLTQGAVLTATSQPNRTSPVKRGEFILARILCTPSPPPPDNVDALAEDMMNEEGRVLTVRERLAEHRANPECAVCHDTMDPLGLALEHYDGIGQWREEELGMPIDASGELPDGTALDGAGSLANVLIDDGRFVGCFSQKLTTFALGRALRRADTCILGDILGRLGAEPTARDLIVELVTHDLFRTIGEETAR